MADDKKATDKATQNDKRAESRDPITPTSIQPKTGPTFATDGSDNQAENGPRIALAPFTAEDPSRSLGQAPGRAPNYPGYPKTKYHPVYGARTAKDPNDEAVAFTGPPHNWFDTAGEADTHRTDREAQMVVHNNQRVKVDAAFGRAENAEHETDPAVAAGDAGVVRNSVQATESVKAGKVEPL